MIVINADFSFFFSFLSFKLKFLVKFQYKNIKKNEWKTKKRKKLNNLKVASDGYNITSKMLHVAWEILE